MSIGRILCLATILNVYLSSFAINVSVDENIEFISAICRTAGFEEYIDDTNQSYANAVDSLMSPYKDHDAIKYLIIIRNKQGVGFDAIANLSVHTEITNGKLILKDGADLSNVDSRWEPGQDKEIVLLLNDLYNKSNFSKFFNDNTSFYEKISANGQELLSQCDIDWLDNFFGKRLSHSRVVVSLLNCGNYGMTQTLQDKPDESVIIICCTNLDEQNIPVFNSFRNQSLIVHESSHPMMNPLIDSNLENFNDNIENMASLMSKELRGGAYAGGRTMMAESMVRTVEIMYKKAHSQGYDEESAESEIKRLMSRGFMFMPEIYDGFKFYVENREKYPIIDDIMPIIIENINNVDVEARYAEYIDDTPTLIGCSMPMDAKDIEPSDSIKISFYFDKPIRKGPWGWRNYNDNEDIEPEKVTPRVSKDGKEIIVEIKATKPNSEYGFGIDGYLFTGLKGYPAKGSQDVHFFTGDK